MNKVKFFNPTADLDWIIEPSSRVALLKLRMSSATALVAAMVKINLRKLCEEGRRKQSRRGVVEVIVVLLCKCCGCGVMVMVMVVVLCCFRENSDDAKKWEGRMKEGGSTKGWLFK